MNNNDLDEQLRIMIRNETKYNRIFDGKVVELKNGRVLCTIDALAFDTPDKGVICTYSDKNSLTDFKIDDNVIIGFRNNDPARAFIIGKANDFIGNTPSSYNFEEGIETIYEDGNSLVTITKDNTLKELKISVQSGWKIIFDNVVNNVTIDSTSVNINNGNHEVLP